MRTKNIFIITFLLLLGLLQSCNEFLVEDPRGRLYSSEFYTTSVESAETAINGLYNLYTNSYSGSLSGVNTYGITPAAQRYISYLTDVTGEDIWVRNTGNSSRQTLDRYTYGPDNANIEFMYFSFYKGIKEANAIIYAMRDEKTDFSREFDSEEQAKAFQNRILGEALTVRAYLYFQIVRFWGDVAVIDKEIVIGEDFNVSRQNFAEVYRDVIISDLLEVIENNYLPTQHSDGLNTVTEGGAKVLLADVYLTLAGRVYDKLNGVIDDSRNELLQKCIALCKDLDGNYGYDLYPNFKDVFTVKGNYSSESVWEVQTETNQFGQETMPNKKKDNVIGFYPYTNELTGNTEYLDGYGRYTMSDQLYDLYNKQYDTRLDNVVDIKNSYKITERNGDTIFTRVSMKYCDSTLIARQIYDSKKSMVAWKLYRFATVLLMWAEAENELNGPTADAISALERVRRRAYRGNEDKIEASPGDPNAFREAVWVERRKELYSEGYRWFDLVRTGTLDKVALEPAGYNYNQYPIVEDKHYLYPIPQIAFELNPLLGDQNQGW